jgi:hypothetical protein
MADAVLDVDAHGKILLRNRAAGALWPAAVRPGDDLRVCHDADRWQKLLARVANPAPNEAHPMLAIGDRSYEASVTLELSGDAQGGLCLFSDGQVESICQGTGINTTNNYYANRPTPLNDIHGIGAVLLAGTEVMKLYQKGIKSVW